MVEKLLLQLCYTVIQLLAFKDFQKLLRGGGGGYFTFTVNGLWGLSDTD